MPFLDKGLDGEGGGLLQHLHNRIPKTYKNMQEKMRIIIINEKYKYKKKIKANKIKLKIGVITPSQLVVLNSWRVKEGNLFLVCNVLCSIGLHSLPFDLEHSIILWVEQIYRAIGVCLMNDEWSNPSGFKFARKKVEFGVVEYDLVPLIENLASYHLIMPFFYLSFAIFEFK